MLRHRWMVDTGAHGLALGPNALRHLEESFTALHDLGLSPRIAAEVLLAVDKFVLGHVSFEVTDHSAAAAARLAARPHFEPLLATGEFPVLSRLIADGVALVSIDPQYEQQFERGLGWLLDGIAADIKP
jgi:Tetracyclin repressor-like, C-terminal domain